MEEFSSQISQYIELVMKTSGGDTVSWFSPNLSAPGVVSRLFLPTELEVTIGLSMIPEIRVTGFVDSDVAEDVLSSDLLNSTNQIYVRFHDPVGKMSSPWFVGFTTKPDVDLGADGASVTINAQGVSAVLREIRSVSVVGKNGELLADLFERVLTKDLTIKVIGLDVLRKDPERFSLRSDFAFSRPKVFDDIQELCQMFGLKLLDRSWADGEADSISVKPMVEIVPLFIASEQPPKVKLVRRMTDEMSSGVAVYPILSFSTESEVVWAPGAGRKISLLGVDKASREPVDETVSADQKEHIADHGADNSTMLPTVPFPYLPDLTLEKMVGYTGEKIPKSIDDGNQGSVGGDANQVAQSMMTNFASFGGSESEFGTVGLWLIPGQRFSASGLGDRFNGEYMANTVVHSVGSEPWSTRLKGVKWAQKEGQKVYHVPMPVEKSGDSEKEPDKV